jgi:arginase
LIREALHPDHATVEVPGAQCGDSEPTLGVRYRCALLEQLGGAKDLLSGTPPRRVLTLGGDCGVDLVAASYAAARHGEAGEVAVLWLDAHADFNTPQSSPSGAFHGMPLRALLGECDDDFLSCSFGAVSPRQVLIAGARALDPAELAAMRPLGVDVLTPSALASDPAAPAKRIASGGYRKVYVHLDLDVLDPGAFPSVSVPTSGGMTVETLLAAITALSDQVEVVGMSVTEFAPDPTCGANDIGEQLAVIRDATSAAGFGGAWPT